MPTKKDYEFVTYLVRKTHEKQIKWEATAQEMQFAASFAGRYVVTVDKAYPVNRSLTTRYWLTMKDDAGRELLTLEGSDVQEVAVLYNFAERASLNVDAAIDEIMGEG
jgi:hypothetical protein